MGREVVLTLVLAELGPEVEDRGVGDAPGELTETNDMLVASGVPGVVYVYVGRRAVRLATPTALHHTLVL